MALPRVLREPKMLERAKERLYIQIYSFTHVVATSEWKPSKPRDGTSSLKCK